MHFRITVLGTSSLRGDEGQLIQSVLRQPRRFALLVYLALESRSGPVRRDTVMGVFWPDSSQESARSALNQAVHYLRRSLGPDAIETHGDSLTVNDRVVSCDAAELLTASEDGRWAEAAELFAGELLPGYFDIGPSADFEHWLDATRARIREEAAKCAWRGAEAEEAGGKAASAVVWARRACAWSAGGEAEVRRLMKTVARLGDRAGALEAFDALSRSLGDVGAEPAPETRELLARLRARWAEEDRAAGPPLGPPGLDRAPAAAAPLPTRPERPRSWRPAKFLRTLPSALVTAGLMIAFLSLWAVTRAPSSTAPNRTTVLIEGLGADEAGAAAARMLRGGVVSQLQEISPLRVVEEADSGAIARERGFIVRGELLRSDGDLQARVHLVEGSQGTVLASSKLDGSTAELPAALEEMARSVAQFVRREVGAALDDRRLVEADVPEEAITAAQLGRQDRALVLTCINKRHNVPCFPVDERPILPGEVPIHGKSHRDPSLAGGTRHAGALGAGLHH
jgi:DNA-binding SARP family transcriptional activator/TolB-like protein